MHDDLVKCRASLVSPEHETQLLTLVFCLTSCKSDVNVSIR